MFGPRLHCRRNACNASVPSPRPPICHNRLSLMSRPVQSRTWRTSSWSNLYWSQHICAPCCELPKSRRDCIKYIGISNLLIYIGWRSANLDVGRLPVNYIFPFMLCQVPYFQRGCPRGISGGDGYGPSWRRAATVCWVRWQHYWDRFLRNSFARKRGMQPWPFLTRGRIPRVTSRKGNWANYYHMDFRRLVRVWQFRWRFWEDLTLETRCA